MDWADPLALSVSFLAFMLPLSIAGANIGWGLVAAAVALRFARGKSIPWKRHQSALETPLYIYLAVAGLACIFGVDPDNSGAAWFKDTYKLWIYLLGSVAFAVLADEGINSLLAVLGALATGMAVAAAIGIGQPLWSELHLGMWSRAHAFVHPVTFGEQMAFAVLGAYCFLEFFPKRRKIRLMAMALLSVSSVALFFSQTRGAILSACAGFAILALLVRKPQERVMATVASVLSFVAAIASDFLPTGRSLIENLSKGAANPQLARWTLWNLAWRMFRDHPWLGIGPGNYRDQFGKYYFLPIDGESTVGNAHNLYLHQLAERGILGAAALAFLLFALCRRSYDRARTKPDALNVWATAATGAFLVMNLTEVALQVEQLWMLFFLIWICSEQHTQSPGSGQLLQ